MKRTNSFLLAVGPGNSTRGPITRQNSLFQIDFRFANDIIPSDEVIIHDSDFEVFYNGNCGGHLKHSLEYRQGTQN